MCKNIFGLSILVWLFSFSTASAQLDSLINSGEKLTKAAILIDSNEFDLASKELKLIDPRDTNYYKSLATLADVYYQSGEYQKAIETASLGLQKNTEFDPEFLLAQGMSYTLLGDFKKAEEIFDAGLSRFPINHAFHLQKGKMHFLNKEYDKAEKLFFQALEISPFNLISHLYLGNIAILRGEKVKGMLALGLYMTVNNSNNQQLVRLERFLSNEIIDEGSVAKSDLNPFERLDGIVRSKVVYDDAYKQVLPINAAIVKQYQLLFEELPKYNFSKPDPYTKYYLPLYLELIKNKHYDSFIFHILYSSSIKLVPEWSKKNTDKLESFYKVVNNTLYQLRAKRHVPELGYGNDLVSCWHYKNGRLESVGNVQENDKKIGQWHFFYDNGVLISKGDFNKDGDKVGQWHFYHKDGKLKSKENFDTGLIERYHANGSLWQKYFLKNGEVEGEVLIYYDCGTLHEKLYYQQSLRNGSGQVFDPNGVVIEKFTYKEDSLDGVYESFFSTGARSSISYYTKGKLNGPFKRFYSNGAKYSEGNYEMGSAEGVWRFYHDNNQVSEEGSFLNDNRFGTFKYYDRKGVLTEEREYDKEGRVHGLNKNYLDGKLQSVFIYNEGKLTKATYYTDEEKEIATYTESNAILNAKSHSITGQISSEYQIKDGKYEGLWKYYYPSGKLKSEYTYTNDQLHGVVNEYYVNGKLKVTVHYANGERHGPYLEYYENGMLAKKGWNQSGYEQQNWTTYYPNGKIKSEQYYLNGQITGKAYYYTSDGQLYYTEEFDNNNLIANTTYNKSGQVISKSNKKGATEEIIVSYDNGQLRELDQKNCNKLNGKLQRFLDNGKLYTEYNYLNGKREGSFKIHYPNGNVLLEGRYTEDEPTGIWKWYYINGQLETIGKYNNEQRDSVWLYYHENGKLDRIHNFVNGNIHGVSKYYSPEGILLIEKKFNNDDLIAYRDATQPTNKWNKYSGNETIRIKFADGKIALEEVNKDGNLHGTKKMYYQNGKLFSSIDFEFGSKNGNEIFYYSNGIVRSKGKFMHGEEHGKFEWFTTTGLPERSEQYEYGMLNGSAFIYSNGKLQKEVKFWGGQLQ
ncbi:MAG: tetratricopeptide repeat protein [Cyclobacteriaceae bacterium]|nr:tetratricopeptide repeat protein [Cytophagales bacterium]MCZ8327807.1 tetratricopeptide repeat protein [Cyclobacteriaceae bacterium]